MVKIVLSLRVAYILVGIFALLLISVGVYAYGTTNPPASGHTLGEFHPSCSGLVYSLGTDNSWSCIPTPPSCSGSNQGLQYSQTTKTWSCIALS